MEAKLRKLVETQAGDIFDNMYWRKDPQWRIKPAPDKATVALSAPAWVHEIVHEVHVTLGAGPDDRVMEFIYKAAGAVADTKDPVSPYGSLRQLEPSVMVADLTTWLNEHVENLEYLHSMLVAESGPPKSGLALLQAAQRAHMADVGVALVDQLVERAKEILGADNLNVQGGDDE
jgi:hypothetical protein